MQPNLVRPLPKDGEKSINELINLSATELAHIIHAKEVSSEEVVNAYLHRIDTINARLNAIVQLRVEAARAQAREADFALARGEIKGPIHGVPFTIKDSLNTADMISTGGTKGRSNFVPKHDATAVTRMRAAGGILIGKTNTPELTMAYETDNLIYGRTSNPYDLSHTCGGSSGGAAAIIAAGGSPLDIGTDSAGSIRVPSHFCGIAGIKPTSGRVPRTGNILPPAGVWDALTQVGPMARFVRDLILTLPIISGVDWCDPAIVPMPLGDAATVDIKSLRIAFHTDNGILRPDSEIIDVLCSAAKALSDAGVFVEEARPLGIEQTFELIISLFAVDSGIGVQRLLKMYGTIEIHPLTAQLLEIMRGHKVSTVEYSDLLIRWDMFRSAMLSFMEHYDAILCPACAFPAQPHGKLAWNENMLPGFSYVMCYNLTGWPGVVVRGGTSFGGLPIAVQVVARPWREDVALAVAQYLEEVLGGWQPPRL